MKNLAIIVSFLFCCNPPKTELTYEESALVDVVIDLYYAESAVKDLDENIKDSLIVLYRQQIAEIHSVDIAIVEKDLLLLQKDAKRYQDFHKIVEDSVAVKLKLTEKDKIKKDPKKK